MVRNRHKSAGLILVAVLAASLGLGEVTVSAAADGKQKKPKGQEQAKETGGDPGKAASSIVDVIKKAAAPVEKGISEGASTAAQKLKKALKSKDKD